MSRILFPRDPAHIRIAEWFIPSPRFLAGKENKLVQGLFDYTRKLFGVEFHHPIRSDAGQDRVVLVLPEPLVVQLKVMGCRFRGFQNGSRVVL
jgi:hypothetical protein